MLRKINWKRNRTALDMWNFNKPSALVKENREAKNYITKVVEKLKPSSALNMYYLFLFCENVCKIYRSERKNY